ncbi:MAG: GNAT family N-acetyltransferase [Anaerolineae bacterium]|nr:GNAT family N-acetyltransferase [Anaerolineae bacterium]
MRFREYEPQKDRKAAHRIWMEIGWLEKGKEEIHDLFVGAGRALVADIEGEPECMVTTVPGTMRYLQSDLLISVVTSVTTSRVARKRGLAKRLAARAIAVDAAGGALVSGLSMFEQGFYDLLGFGTGVYEHQVSFDPALLNVDVRPRLPRRLTLDDWAMIHASRLARHRGHGACNLTPPELTRAEMQWTANGFGLGYCDGPNGELTHHFWCHVKDVEHGPYQISWMAYQTPEQFLELMGLLKSLGDQVWLVKMQEPHGIQLQSLLSQPFKRDQVSRDSKFESGIRASAYWQMRICNLPGCLEHTHLMGPTVRFNLRLSDPIERFLDDDAPWHGVAGEYVVTLGPESGARRGQDDTLPTLTASVGAFTRLWLGVCPATGLAITDDLRGPHELLEELDRVLCLPTPGPDWGF